MTWDPVPWFVGGGAQHSPEVARLMAFAATSGAEGIVTPGDLKVVPLDVPGARVRVLPGAALVLNRSVGGSQQTYVARLPQADDVDIAATGSSGGRSDLIIARVKDPFMAGNTWPTPTDPTVGPYVFSDIVPNVPAGTKRLQDLPQYANDSAITLARIDLPKSTGTVTAEMITSLRQLATPRYAREILMSGPTPGLRMNNPSGAIWPDYTPTVTIPAWATHGYVVATLSSIGQDGGAAQGIMTVVLEGSTMIRANDIGYDLDAPTSGGSRHTLIVGGGGDWRNLAGQTVTVRLEAAQVLPATNPGSLFTVPGTQVIYDVSFYERAV